MHKQTCWPFSIYTDIKLPFSVGCASSPFSHKQLFCSTVVNIELSSVWEFPSLRLCSSTIFTVLSSFLSALAAFFDSSLPLKMPWSWLVWYEVNNCGRSLDSLWESSVLSSSTLVSPKQNSLHCWECFSILSPFFRICIFSWILVLFVERCVIRTWIKASFWNLITACEEFLFQFSIDLSKNGPVSIHFTAKIQHIEYQYLLEGSLVATLGGSMLTSQTLYCCN